MSELAAVPRWFMPNALAILEWRRRHPSEAFPVPSHLRDTAATWHGSVARVLLSFLRRAGIPSTYGELPRAELLKIREELGTSPAEPVACPAHAQEIHVEPGAMPAGMVLWPGWPGETTGTIGQAQKVRLE